MCDICDMLPHALGQLLVSEDKTQGITAVYMIFQHKVWNQGRVRALLATHSKIN